MKQRNSTVNYTHVLAKLKLDFDFPGLPTMKRAPDPFPHRKGVDIHIAKKQRDLLHQIPKITITSRSQLELQLSDYHIERNILTELIDAGYGRVVDELINLTEKEMKEFQNHKESGCPRKMQSFLDDKECWAELLNGLKESADAEAGGSTLDYIVTKIALGETILKLGNYWLAKELFTGTLAQLVHVDDIHDKLRVELWCLISYICIYHEESPDSGFDLPTTYLRMAQELSRTQSSWYMESNIMEVYVPKTINVYGLRNEWIQLNTDFAKMYSVATILLHVVSIKKARYWQEEAYQFPEFELQYNKNAEDSLVSALNYADEVLQVQAFLATTLRIGLFYDEQDNTERAWSNYSALHLLAKTYDDKECLAMAMNRLGQKTKGSKKATQSLEYFVQAWELATAHDFKELIADSMQDIGTTLLEEGHLWEADECYSQAFEIFSSTKRDDTPNDFDEMAWAMCGVTRGHQLWSRYSGLIRSQQEDNIQSVFKWRCTRHPLPTVSAKRQFKPQKLIDYHVQYHPEEDTRRLFEFEDVELRKDRRKLSEMYHELFNMINASDKPRVRPHFVDFDYSDMSPTSSTSVLQKEKQGSVFVPKTDGHAHQWRKKQRSLTKWSVLREHGVPLDVKLDALLEYINAATPTITTDDENITTVMSDDSIDDDEGESENDNASEQSEGSEETHLSRMPSDVIKEFHNFDTNSEIF